MKEVYNYDVYNLAEELSDMIWIDYDQWNTKTKKTIGYQITRSADSISANIAEGFGRYTPPDRRRFYYYARGSFEETKCWLRKLVRREVISDKRANEYKKIIDTLGPKLNNYINKTKI